MSEGPGIDGTGPGSRRWRRTCETLGSVSQPGLASSSTSAGRCRPRSRRRGGSCPSPRRPRPPPRWPVGRHRHAAGMSGPGDEEPALGAGGQFVQAIRHPGGRGAGPQRLVQQDGPGDHHAVPSLRPRARRPARSRVVGHVDGPLRRLGTFAPDAAGAPGRAAGWRFLSIAPAAALRPPRARAARCRCESCRPSCLRPPEAPLTRPTRDVHRDRISDLATRPENHPDGSGDGGPAMGPRARRLDLGAEGKEGGLVGRAAHELDGRRQAGSVQSPGDDGRRLARGVEDGLEG